LKMIRENGMNPGDRLLSEKKLGQSFNVNHVTVRAALSDLERDGIVERRPGSGTFLTGSLSKADSFPVAEKKLTLIVLREAEHFFSKLRQSIVHELEKSGHMCLSSSISDSASIMIEQLKSFQEQGVKKLIIDQDEMKHPELVEFFNSRECKFENIVRVLGNGFCKERVPGIQVTGDYEDAYMNAVRVLKDEGHKKIAFFCGTTENCNDFWMVNMQYINLYTSAMINNGLAEYIMVRQGTGDNELDAAIDKLLTGQDKPTAIFADIDYRGVKLIERAREFGIAIPEDLSLIGFNDTPWSEHFNLSTFRFRFDEFAKAVAEAMDNKIGSSEKILIPIDYIEKKTVSHPKK